MEFGLSSDYSENKIDVSYIKLFLISLSQIAVSTIILLESAFIISEFQLLGWPTSILTAIFGLATLSEITRLFFGHVADNSRTTRKYIVIGSLMTLTGLLLIPLFASSSINFLVLLPLCLIGAGSAGVGTLVDAHMTAISFESNRRKVALISQLTRLLGFVMAGFVGGALYSMIESSKLDFWMYIFLMSSIVGLLFGVSLLFIKESDRIDRIPIMLDLDKSFVHPVTIGQRMKGLQEILRDKVTTLLFIFLTLYPLSLFIQDFALESFAILVLGFTRKNITTMTQISSLLTILFVIVGAWLQKEIGQLKTFNLGAVIIILGVFSFMLSSLLSSSTFLYVGLIIFYIGSGTFSVPGITYLFNVAGRYSNQTTTLLASAGIIVTFSRSFAGILTGVFLEIGGMNFFIVFLFEFIISIIMLFPILQLDKVMKTESESKVVIT